MKTLNLADAAELMARQKLGVGADWKAYHWEILDATSPLKIRITGSVPIGVYTHGPRAGTPIWGPRKHGKTVTLPLDKVRELVGKPILEQPQ